LQGTLQAVELPDIIRINQLFYLVATPSPALITTLLRRRSMKLVKNFVFALLLASVLAVSAPAGELGTPGVANPAPTPTPERAMSTSDEETSAFYSDSDAASDTSDYLLFEALLAFLSVY
jgi:hypothetical protein